MKIKLKAVKEQRKLVKAEIRRQREKFTSNKSELICYAKVMTAYFNFINEAKTTENFEETE